MGNQILKQPCESWNITSPNNASKKKKSLRQHMLLTVIKNQYRKIEVEKEIHQKRVKNNLTNSHQLVVNDDSNIHHDLSYFLHGSISLQSN